MSRFLKVPSPATVMAALALFVSLGGTAWAVKQIGTNQIKNNAVTTNKIKNGAVTGGKLANGTVSPSKTSMMWALIGADGSVLQSSPGVTYSPGLSGRYYVYFPKSVTGRSIQAALKAVNTAQPTSNIAVSQCGSPTFDDSDPVRVNCMGANTDNEVLIEIFNDNGDPQAKSFYITVW